MEKVMSLRAHLVGAENRKAFFLAVTQICVIVNFPSMALIGASVAFAQPKFGTFFESYIAPAIDWVVHKAKSSVLMFIVGCALVHTFGKQLVVLEVIFLPEMLAVSAENWMLGCLLYPFFWAFSFSIGVHIFMQNVAALPRTPIRGNGGAPPDSDCKKE
eukprot:TRINITY_DN34649_c0_g1_i2.p1 TRINITY_DN34649_c0_g1~~TRINITY_DN34649_c0_g1_i2.p1  ORF type:complete len:159 (-),score=23.10 TRINITY_DN34649_c0_g1_i2:118-594(-)